MSGARVKVKVPPGLPAHARLLIAVRRDRGWTQARLAGELGVDRSTVARWERGEKDPHPMWLAAIKALVPLRNGAS